MRHSKFDGLSSALGQKQTLRRSTAMSAIHPKADIMLIELVRLAFGKRRAQEHVIVITQRSQRCSPVTGK